LTMDADNIVASFLEKKGKGLEEGSRSGTIGENQILQGEGGERVKTKQKCPCGTNLGPHRQTNSS